MLHAIRAMRYPQAPGSADFEPDGIRGSSPSIAALYWGLSTREYRQRADIWKLDPAGSLIPIFIIENKLGVENVRDIARTLSEGNIGAILWAGSGDLNASYAGDREAVAAAVDVVLATGKEFGLPVGVTGTNDLVRRVEQGARMLVSIGFRSQPPSDEMRRSVGTLTAGRSSLSR